MFLLYCMIIFYFFFFFSSRRRHTRSKRDWSSDVCSSDLFYFAGHGLVSETGGYLVTADGVPDDYGITMDELYSRSEEHTSELQSRFDLVCRLLLEKKNHINSNTVSEE